MVSRNRLGGGEDDSNTVCRFSGSTAEVSQESKPSLFGRNRASRRPCRSREAGRLEDLRLPESSRVLDVMGRTTCESDERIELMVSVVERPALDPGGVGKSNETLPRVFAETGVVSW
jgi:hypothetical protein